MAPRLVIPSVRAVSFLLVLCAVLLGEVFPAPVGDVESHNANDLASGEVTGEKEPLIVGEEFEVVDPVVENDAASPKEPAVVYRTQTQVVTLPQFVFTTGPTTLPAAPRITTLAPLVSVKHTTPGPGDVNWHVERHGVLTRPQEKTTESAGPKEEVFTTAHVPELVVVPSTTDTPTTTTTTEPTKPADVVLEVEAADPTTTPPTGITTTSTTTSTTTTITTTVTTTTEDVGGGGILVEVVDGEDTENTSTTTAKKSEEASVTTTTTVPIIIVDDGEETPVEATTTTIKTMETTTPSAIVVVIDVEEEETDTPTTTTSTTATSPASSTAPASSTEKEKAGPVIIGRSKEQETTTGESKYITPTTTKSSYTTRQPTEPTTTTKPPIDTTRQPTEPILTTKPPIETTPQPTEPVPTTIHPVIEVHSKPTPTTEPPSDAQPAEPALSTKAPSAPIVTTNATGVVDTKLKDKEDLEQVVIIMDDVQTTVAVDRADNGSAPGIGESKQEGLSSGARTGIAIGCIVGFWIILGPLVCLICKMRDKKRDKKEQEERAAREKVSNHLVEDMVKAELTKTPTRNSDHKKKQYNGEGPFNNGEIEPITIGDSDSIAYMDADAHSRDTAL